MWPVHWQDQYCKKISIFLVIFFFYISKEIHAKTPTQGIFSALDYRISRLKDSRKLKDSYSIISNTKNIKTLKISKDYVQEILFYSDMGFIKWAKADVCKFYSLMENSLLYDANSERPLEFIFVEYQDLLGNVGSGKIPLNDFLQFEYRKKCLAHLEIKKSFSKENFVTTVQNMEFLLPKNNNECVKSTSKWNENIYVPYLCKYAQLPINGGSKLYFELKSQLGNFIDEYVNLLCQSIKKETPYSWCKNYSSSDFWIQSSNSQIDPQALTTRSRLQLQKLDKSELSTQELKDVANKMVQDKKICETMGQEIFPSALRGSDCNELSSVLRTSRLKNNFIDAPMKLQDTFITSMGRILHHFEGNFDHTQEKTPGAMMNAYFAKFFLEKRLDAYWRYYACYLHLVDKTKVCYPMILGVMDSSPLSEDKVISKILMETKGASSNLQCVYHKDKNFKLSLLDHTKGCSLVVDSNKCHLLDCPKKIYLDGIEQNHIQYVSGANFEWIATSYKTKIYSFNNLMEESNYLLSKIENITQLESFFSKTQNGILYGVGCAQILFPQIYPSHGLNMCTPLSFILDGYEQKNSMHLVSIKSPLESVLQSKFILWDRIIGSIIRYVSLHPEKFWSLYGIQKKAL